MSEGADPVGMGEAVDRLTAKLARVVVPPYLREHSGHIENVSGYEYERSGRTGAPLPPIDRLPAPALKKELERITGVPPEKQPKIPGESPGPEATTAVEPFSEPWAGRSEVGFGRVSVQKMHAMLKKAGFQNGVYTPSKRGPGIGISKPGYALRPYSWRDAKDKWHDPSDEFTITVKTGDGGLVPGGGDSNTWLDSEFARLQQWLQEAGFQPQPLGKRLLHIVAPKS